MEQYLEDISNFKPIEITKCNDEEILFKLDNVVGLILKDCGKEGTKNSIIFCLREMIYNARKANIKRIFFDKRKTDIEDEISYNKEIVYFRNEYESNLKLYLKMMNTHPYDIKVLIDHNQEYLTFKIINNFPLLKIESERIIQKSKQFLKLNASNPFSVADALDEIEGAGIGIIMILLSLKKIGIASDNFYVNGTPTSTEAILRIPVNDLNCDN